MTEQTARLRDLKLRRLILRTLANALISPRRGLTASILRAEIKAATQKVVAEQLADVRDRLDKGEAAFEKLAERDRHLEIFVSNKIDGLKDWIRENAAGKQDLASHERVTGERYDALDDRMRTVAETVPEWLR